jgi:anthranilate phosphoribosyltransferase
VITSAIRQLVEGRDLSGEEAHAAMMQVMSGEASPAQIAAFVVGLRMKGETPDEVAGCARAMRAHATPATPSRDGLVDTCGTGGDGADTFNISTSAALVAAAAGVPIAKHGNRAVSSLCGSADVLEALGVRIDLPPGDVADCIDEVGFGFLFAQAHHPAMRHAGPVRRELAVRTVFNLLGPLTNPAGARRQVMGVYAEHLVEPMAQVLARLGVDHALVVHGAGGLDELTPTGENLMAEVRDGSVLAVTTLDPRPLSTGPAPGTPEDLRVGGDPAHNAAVIRTVFDGERGPRRDAVILNAAAAMLVGGQVDDFEVGIDAAVETIDSGAAQRKLDELVAFTQARATDGGG